MEAIHSQAGFLVRIALVPGSPRLVLGSNRPGFITKTAGYPWAMGVKSRPFTQSDCFRRLINLCTSTSKQGQHPGRES